MPSKFTEDEQTRILLVLALNGGHSVRAAAQLHEEGFDISARHLRNLIHTDRYQQVREQHAPQIEKDLIGHYRDAARRAVELQIVATEQAIEHASTYALERPNPENYDDDEHDQYVRDMLAWKQRGLKDPAKTAQNAALASGIALDKAFMAEGRPNVIHATHGVDELVTKLQRALGFDATSTATEEPQDTTPAVPLLPESASANARDQASSSTS
jgi:hypothetical protein